MNSRKIIYFVFILIELLIAWGLEFLTDSRGPLLGDIDNLGQIQYVFGIVCTLSVILAVYFVIKKKQMNPLLRMSLVMSGVNLVLFDYYFFYDTNLLYCLLILGIAYLFIWPSIDNQEKEV